VTSCTPTHDLPSHPHACRDILVPHWPTPIVSIRLPLTQPVGPRVLLRPSRVDAHGDSSDTSDSTSTPTVMALLNHAHDWSSTHDGWLCLNCSATISQSSLTPFLAKSGTYGSGTYGSGTYGNAGGGGPKTVIHGDYPTNVPDLVHLVDYVWYQLGGTGVPT
jgi:hypothetical protein